MYKFIKIHERKLVSGAALFLFALNFVIWQNVFLVSKKAELSVSFFDVGQGDSILIESKDGSQILIDGGPNAGILSSLGKAMPYGDDFIDVVIVSHPHADHILGLIEVLNRYRVGMVIESGVRYDTDEIREFRRIVREKKIKRLIADSQSKLSFYEGAGLKFIFPGISYEDKKVKDVNETSLVALLEYGGRSVLFTGDAGKEIENKLIYGDLLEDIDVLKVGHQGSRFSSTREFLENITPEYAVISVGKNSYGHPHPDALSRLAAVGARVFRTDRDGTITLEIRNGELFWKK